MSVQIRKSLLNIFNPATGDQISSLPITSFRELEIILDNANKIASTYNSSSFFYRQHLMLKFRKGIVKHMDSFVDIICAETGKKEFEGLMEVFISLEHLEKSSKNLYEALSKKSRKIGILITKKAWIEYEALGVAGIISPWNYPLILTISPMVEALLAGNSVVLKPSENSPLTAQLLKKIWDESTNEPMLFQTIYGSHEIGAKLVSSTKTDVICFTGSTAVGKEIAKICASQFKPVILELGGKDPMIILDDADIKRSVDAAIWGGFSNAGQTCLSVERIYAQEPIYHKIVDCLTHKIKNMSSGKNDMIGAISSKESLKKIKMLFADVKEKSTLVNGKAENGWFIPPTLVINPLDNAKILQEETFGPVMSIESFKSDDEAIILANNTGYGLSASIFSKNTKRMKNISKRIKVGTVSFNDVMTHYGIADLPFGGMGLSGIGKVHGKEGLRAFSNQKSYISNRIELKFEYWWYEHSKKFSKYLRKWIIWRYS